MSATCPHPTRLPRWTRRRFLRAATAAGCAFFVPGAGRRARAQEPAPVLVALFLRGAADGMSLVVPRGDPRYYALRPRIAVPRGEERVLDAFYGLHPALAPLVPLYERGELAFLHAAGSPDPSRSHFEAQDHMERAVLGASAVTTGWLNRLLVSEGEASAFAGVTLGTSRALSLHGPGATVALPSIEDYALSGDLAAERGAALTAMYAGAEHEALRAAAAEAFASIDLLAGFDQEPRAAFPGTDLGRALRDAAALIRSGIGVRAVAIDMDGWDHHARAVKRTNAGATHLAEALAAFHADLGPLAASTLTLCTTEFGRTAGENGSGGTDHGHGSVMIALGGGIRGGRVLTRGGWPGLEPENLWEGRDLAVTTDFRDVFAEVLVRHMRVRDLPTVLPGFRARRRRFPGLLPA